MEFNEVMGLLHPIFRDVFDDDELVIEAKTLRMFSSSLIVIKVI
jgi:hypothetical protein